MGLTPPSGRLSHRRNFNTTQLPATPLLFEPAVDETVTVPNLYYSILLTDLHIARSSTNGHRYSTNPAQRQPTITPILLEEIGWRQPYAQVSQNTIDTRSTP